jgi:acetate kinase
MGSVTVRALAVNCGSSSLKYALFDARDGEAHAIERATIERIGTAVPDHAAAVEQMVDALDAKGIAPDVVGHRVVHGGAEHAAPAPIDPGLLASLEALVPFAPLHLPPEIRAIRATLRRWPGLPQVACFDTAFHASLTEVAARYAIPERLHAAGIRKYGFHGLSYESIVSSLGGERLGRAVLAHLGNGCSMAAVRDGRAIDTTMGFTPSAGLVMGTRAGDVDPGMLIYLADQGYDGRALDRVVNHEGGLLAVSGTTADVRDLLARRARDPRAALAIDVFVWSARKWVGAMAAALGGMESLVFTGGIGQHAAPVRSAIADGLAHLGVAIDAAANDAQAAVVSPPGARCTVYVVATDEERVIALHACRAASRS